MEGLRWKSLMLLEVIEQPRKHDHNQSAGIFPLLMQLYKT